jgi:parallel beta-helix repeat protein
MSLFLVTCGGTEPKADVRATEVAAGVAATLTAEAPPPQTVTAVTLSPQPTAGIDLMNLRLEADGSGDLSSLENALAQSEVGATITLGPGTYRLDRAITVGGSLHLVGAGQDQTEIIASVPDWVLSFQGDGPFTATGITFRHDGDTPADVVTVNSGEVCFEDCRFSGAVWSEGAGGGSGLSLGDSVTGEVSGCESLANGLYGILLWDEAQVELRDNVLMENDDTGIAYFGHSGGKVLQNEVIANTRYGIYVDEWAAPTLESNTLRDNGEAGIAYFGNAAGMAEGNICAGNASTAIYVGENAAPWLADNECVLEGTMAETSAPWKAGREIAYSAWRDDNEDVYAMYSDGTGVIRLTDDLARDNGPAWSPDGTRIAFVSERDGNSEIYVMNADGSGQTRLTNNPGQDVGPDWSPDGTQIAYAAELGENWGTYVIDPNGGERSEISPEGMAGTNPSWSPDGKRIVMTVYVNRTSLLAMLNVETGELISLTQEGDQDSQPAWSPDGGRIAFISSADMEGNFVGPDLYVIDANGLDRTRLTSDDSTESSPTWSPDGVQIAFAGTGDGYGAIYRINADGTGLARLSMGSDPSGGPSWSPVPAPPRGPRFNPNGDPWCLNTPEVGATGDWQVVGPRDLVLPGDRAEIGLRDNAGEAGGARPITARIIAPDEREAVASATMNGEEWVMLIYPDDFGTGQTGQRGAYTIIWETEGQFVACDGFNVGGGAGP